MWAPRFKGEDKNYCKNNFFIALRSQEFLSTFIEDYIEPSNPSLAEFFLIMFGFKSADDPIDFEFDPPNNEEDNDAKEWLRELVKSPNFRRMLKKSPALVFRLLDNGYTSSDTESTSEAEDE